MHYTLLAGVAILTGNIQRAPGTAGGKVFTADYVHWLPLSMLLSDLNKPG